MVAPVKRKIAVLGGGAASLFAVWDLMEASPDAYDITVYQMGWRLGGKGASGRGPRDRIEEHGLHLMFGFYENVFRVMRQAYKAHYTEDDEMWRRFFKTDDTQVAMIHFLDPLKQAWEPWQVPYPQSTGSGLPGDPGFVDGDNGLLTILRNMWAWLAGLIRRHGSHLLAAVAPAYGTHTLDQLRDAIEGMLAPAIAIVTHPFEVHVWQLADAFLECLAGNRHAIDLEGDRQYIASLRRMVTAALGHLGLPPGVLAMARFVTAVATGLAMDVFIPHGKDWFSIDNYDLREWLALHDYDPHDDANAPPVDGLYDAVFASYSQLGAGSILQAALKAAFLFRGGAIWKMQAGMGDTIFTPLFRALQKRGVKFKFFHRVDRLRLSPDHTVIDQIEIDRQVDAPSYDPLVKLQVDVGGPIELECWPSGPRWNELPAGTARVNFENYWTPRGNDLVTLERGIDYDDVILGISVAALPALCGELFAADPAFARHVACLGPRTTATEAMQLWMTKAPVQPAPLVVPNGDPYDTIANMSQLRSAEAAPPEVCTITYSCSALFERSPAPPRSVTEYPGQLQATAEADGMTWVSQRAPILWRNLATAPGSFDWDALYDPANGHGVDRFAAQYVNAPCNLSDRYVLPVPMSFQHRLVSNGTAFANLYITGDWIKTSLSIGCLECAAMSGIQAARALSLERGPNVVPRARNAWIYDVQSRASHAPQPQALAATATVHARAATYRQRDGELIAPPPYEVTCDNLYMFFLEADRDTLAQAVAADLNGVGARTFRPFADWVVLYAATLSNLALGTSCRSSEVGLWAPIVRDDEPSVVRMYSPYVWLDSATSTIVGRSVYGYTKQTAQVTIPSAPGTITVVGDALVATAGQPPEVQRVPLVTAKVMPPAHPKPWDPSNVLNLVNLAELAARALAIDPAIVLGIAGGMQSVFLKQLPAPDGYRPSYQAIVEATLSPRLISVGGQLLPGNWTIETPVYPQPRISDVLGLAATTRFDAGNQRVSVITPIAQFWARFRGTLHAGVEVP